MSDLPFVGNRGAGERFDEARLAGAVGADDRENFSRQEIEVGALVAGELHDFVDEVQVAINAIHTGIANAWFAPAVSTVNPSVSMVA